MIPQEIAAYVREHLQAEDTAQFATALKEMILNGNEEDAKIIADQLESVGITIAGIPCKSHPA